MPHKLLFKAIFGFLSICLSSIVVAGVGLAAPLTKSIIPTPDINIAADCSRPIYLLQATNRQIESEIEGRFNKRIEPIKSDIFQIDSDTHEVFIPLVMKRWPPIPETPVLNPITTPDGRTNFSVNWSTAALAETYVLQEAVNPEFADPVQQYSGPATFWNATNKSPGTYYYRVKALNTWGESGWSNTGQVTVSSPMVDVNVENNTGGELCYEVFDTGIGRKCFPSGRHFYGRFPAGTYSYHASARCGSISESNLYAPGDFIHTFWCE
jgi:hypothetical protein